MLIITLWNYKWQNYQIINSDGQLKILPSIVSQKKSTLKGKIFIFIEK